MQNLIIKVDCAQQKYIHESSPTLLKKRPWHRCFPENFVKFLRTPFSQNTSERLSSPLGLLLFYVLLLLFFSLFCRLFKSFF